VADSGQPKGQQSKKRHGQKGRKSEKKLKKIEKAGKFWKTEK
jgi:hypothetical protein